MAAYYPTRFQNTSGLAWATVVGLALLAVGYVFQIAAGFGQFAAPNISLDGDAGVGGSLWLTFQLLAVFVRLPLFIITSVLFLMWLYRSNANLVPLRANHREYEGGWTIGWWFIPIASLFKPYQVVREVWNESDPEFDASMGFMPLGGGGGPVFMGWWWAFWISSTIFSNITWRVLDPDNKGLAEITAALFTVTGVLSLGAALLAIVLVRKTTLRQQLRYAAIAALPQNYPVQPPGFVPPPPPPFGGYA
jgi:hypothetical protein